MSIDKLEVFASQADKNTDGLTLKYGFPSAEKPARQWFNWLFYTQTAKINEVVDLTNTTFTRIKDMEVKYEQLRRDTAQQLQDTQSSLQDVREYADQLMQTAVGGKLAYKTYAEMIADKSNIAAKSSIDILADTDDKNGTYLYDGANFVKSQYDLEKIIRAKVQNTFGTYAQMLASNLSDGAYALVADDTDDKNGIYIKEAGAWVESKYDIKTLIDNSVGNAEYRISGGAVLQGDIVANRKVNPTNSSGVLGRDDNSTVIRYDISGLDEVLVEGATENLGWQWLVTDDVIDKRISITGNYGNGIIKIPQKPEAKWLVRTYQSISEGVIESDVKVTKKFNKTLKDIDEQHIDKIELFKSTIDAKADGYVITKQLAITPIDGALVNNNRATEVLLATGSGRQYIYYDVSNVDELVISGAREDNDGFEWAFADEVSNTATRHSFADFIGNGVLKIPDGVKFAVRSYYFEGNETYPKQAENSEMVIKAARVGPTQEDWERLIKTTTGSDVFYNYAQKAIKESGLNVYKLSDFEGNDSHDKIDTAIEFIKLSGNGGVLDLESGVHKRRSAVLMPDNFWLYLNDSTLMLADGVHDNLIRNEGVVIPDDPFAFSPQLNENRNIRVFGNGKDRSFIKGPDVPKTAPHPINGGDPVPWVGDWYGWRTLEVNLLNVKDYAIHGLSLINSRCWGITQQHGCENFEIHDIGFDNNVKNGDGIDVLMGCKNFNIYNISGHTADDTVALSAVNEYVISLPDRNYIYPMMLGSWTDRGFGIDITDGRISNILGAGNYHGLRLLEAGGSQIKRISVNGVRDDINHPRKGYAEATVVCDTGYGRLADQGDISNITVNNVESHRAKYSLKFRGPMSDAIFNNITQHNSNGAAIAEAPTLASFVNVKFTNITGSRIQI